MASREIKYVEVDELTRSPGMTFHHADHIYGTIAFVVGYGWMRAPKNPVRVELLKPKDRPPGEDPAVWKKIVDEVKLAVKFHVDHGGSGKRQGGNVSIREIL